MNLHTAQ